MNTKDFLSVKDVRKVFKLGKKLAAGSTSIIYELLRIPKRVLRIQKIEDVW